MVQLELATADYTCPTDEAIQEFLPKLMTVHMLIQAVHFTKGLELLDGLRETQLKMTLRVHRH